MADQRKTVAGEVVVLDYAELQDTIYRRCKLVYKGGTPPTLVGCDFIECTFLFENEALNTMRFIAALAHSGDSGRDLVVHTLLRLPANAG